MAGFWKDVMAAAIESTPTGQAIGQIKQAKTDYDTAKNPPPPAPPTPLTLQQQQAVAGAQANKQRPILTMAQPAGAPQPQPFTPFNRTAPKMATGVRPLLPVPPPKVFTPQQQQAIAGAQANKQRPNLQVAQSWDPYNDPDWQPEDMSAPTTAPVAKSRTQNRTRNRGLGPQAEAAFNSLRQHLGNQ